MKRYLIAEYGFVGYETRARAAQRISAKIAEARKNMAECRSGSQLYESYEQQASVDNYRILVVDTNDDEPLEAAANEQDARTAVWRAKRAKEQNEQRAIRNERRRILKNMEAKGIDTALARQLMGFPDVHPVKQ